MSGTSTDHPIDEVALAHLWASEHGDVELDPDLLELHKDVASYTDFYAIADPDLSGYQGRAGVGRRVNAYLGHA